MKRRFTASFLIAACALVAAGIVLAFLAIGTPAHNRQLGSDEKRTAGLDEMAIALRGRYRARLPRILERDFAADAFLRHRFDDPQTGLRYAYRRIDADRFSLCATFSAPSDPAVHPEVSQTDWPHPAGVFCKYYSIQRPMSG